LTLSPPRSILVIQLRRIGDVILTTPAVAALKRRHPDAAIDFLAEEPGSQALRGNPHIRRILVYGAGPGQALAWLWRVRRSRYDWVIDYLGNPRSALLAAASSAAVRAGWVHVAHRWAYNLPLRQPDPAQYAGREKMLALRALGVEADDADFMPRVYLTDGTAPQPENLVGLAPASRQETRRWPAASFAKLGRLLRERYGCGILVFWGPGERGLAEGVAAGIGPGARISEPTPDLAAAARLLARCRLLVANCNGPKHLAVALGVSTVTVHGSSDPASWTPPHPDHAAVRLAELPCIGCRLNRCPRHRECLEFLTAERVFTAASVILERGPAPSAGSITERVRRHLRKDAA